VARWGDEIQGKRVVREGPREKGLRGDVERVTKEPRQNRKLGEMNFYAHTAADANGKRLVGADRADRWKSRMDHRIEAATARGHSKLQQLTKP
jgi:hypothetical protein